MGICISRPSSEIHEIDYGHENVIYYQHTNGTTLNASKRVGSLHTHQGTKGFNQDAAILFQGYGTEDGAFCGVFDGHGKNGHVVSKLVRNRLASLILSQKTKAKAKATTLTLVEGVEEDTDESNKASALYVWKEACLNGFRAMDREIKLLEGLDCSCSGTAAVVVIRQGADLVIANLGDSRAVLGTMAEHGIMSVQLTTDLKPGLPTETERIKKCNGRVIALKEEPHIQRVWLPHNGSPGLAMSRAFGDFLLKHHGIISTPDVSFHRLSPQDKFLVLATDGVWDVLSNNKVVSIVWAAESEESAARAVVEAATAAWQLRFPSLKRDDCTAICLFLQEKQASEHVH